MVWFPHFFVGVFGTKMFFGWYLFGFLFFFFCGLFFFSPLPQNLGWFFLPFPPPSHNSQGRGGFMGGTEFIFPPPNQPPCFFSPPPVPGVPPPFLLFQDVGVAKKEEKGYFFIFFSYSFLLIFQFPHFFSTTNNCLVERNKVPTSVIFEPTPPQNIFFLFLIQKIGYAPQIGGYV